MRKPDRNDDEPDRYVVAVYEAPLMIYLGENQEIAVKPKNFLKIGWLTLLVSIQALLISDKDGRRRYLVTPDYSGDPSFTRNLDEAFKFRSRNQAKMAGGAIGVEFEVLTTSYLAARLKGSS